MEHPDVWHGPQGSHHSGQFLERKREEIPRPIPFPAHLNGSIGNHQYHYQPPSSEHVLHIPSRQNFPNSLAEGDFVPDQTRPNSYLQASFGTYPEVPPTSLRHQPQPPYGGRWSQSSQTENPLVATLTSEKSLFVNSTPRPYLSPTSLPIAVPQMSKGKGVPFQRIYAPALQEYDISERDFVIFIDTLNMVSAASPPFKVLDLAGGVIGMVPHHWAQLASNAMKLAAMGGTAIVSKSRTDAFLSDANQTLFGPRRLRARLITTVALLATIRFPQEKTVALPLNANVPLDQQPSFHTRLLHGLRGYVSDTVLTSLPPLHGDNNILDKMSAGQVARDMKKIDKKIMKESEKQMKRNNKKQDTRHAMGGLETDGVDQECIRSKSLERKIEKVHKEAKKKMDSGKYPAAQIEEEKTEAVSMLLKKREHDAHPRNHHHDKHAKKGIDDKFVEKLLWIFIDNASGDPEL